MENTWSGGLDLQVLRRRRLPAIDFKVASEWLAPLTGNWPKRWHLATVSPTRGVGRPQGLDDIREQRPLRSNCSQIAEQRPPHGGFAIVSAGRVPKQQEQHGR